MSDKTILPSYDITEQIDPSCTAESNLQHIKCLLEGYRAFILQTNGVQVDNTYSGGPKKISFQYGQKLAEQDSGVIARNIPPLFNFRKFRKKAGLTLRRVEEITGISNSYLSQLETGKIKKPSFEVVKKLHFLYTKYKIK